MTSKKIYLDTNIFVAYMHKKHKKHLEVSECLSIMEELDLECFYSIWALMELEWTLVKDYGFSPASAKKKILDILDKEKLKKIHLKFISFNKTDSANNLLWLIRESKINTGLHLSDSIHSLLMNKSGIENILTMDNDFSALKEVTSISPKQISLLKSK